MNVQLLSITDPSPGNLPTIEQFIEYCGRVCWRTDLAPDSTERFIRAIIKKGHTSVIEHLRFIFRISNASDGDFLDIFTAAQGIALTVRDNVATMSMNARSLRDIAHVRNTELSHLLLESASWHAPIFFEDFMGAPRLIDTPSAVTAPETQNCNVLMLGINVCDELDQEELTAHGSATFKITQVSRAYSHQTVRHRLASFSQESMRYVDMDGQQAVEPPTIMANLAALDLYRQSVLNSFKTYKALRNLGIRKEDARFVLPIGTQTAIVITKNFEWWRHFIKLRATKHAQWEIRGIANAVLEILHNQAPVIFEDLVK